MITVAVVFALLLAPPQQTDSAPQSAIEQQARVAYEQHRKAAIRINNLAAQIHSEADATAFVAQIADIFSKELPPVWATHGILQRVAHAEYQSVHDSANLIPEQQVANVWNEYVREIGAPEETLVTAAEIHNMRDGEFTGARLMWARGQQTIWAVPSIYAVGSDGRVSPNGCRAVEALRLIHDLHDLFQNLQAARDRVRKGILASDEVANRMARSKSRPRTTSVLQAGVEEANPIWPAEYRYVKEHGSEAFSQVLRRLFDELFPPN